MPACCKSPPVSRRLQRAVAELARIHGIEGAAKILAIGKESVLRIIAGVGVRRGTLAITVKRLADHHDDAERTGGHA